MNTDKENRTAEAESVEPLYPEQPLTRQIIEAAFAVHNSLGSGFLEKVYENALALELRQKGIPALQQSPLKVFYKGILVGDYTADLVVGGKVLLELKACSALDPVFEAQILNYLRASGLRVGLLLNFGRPKLQYRRFVL